MDETVDISESTPTYERRPAWIEAEWEEKDCGEWVYVTRTNRRGDVFTVCRYLNPDWRPSDEDHDSGGLASE